MSTFEFPIRKADGNPFADAEQLHRLLESETSGHYLLSKSDYWHSGIHLSNESVPHCVYNQPVRCMADGEVVAYRLNRDYLTSQVAPDAEPLQYSTSFCLVRHKYQSAPNPEEGPNVGKHNELTFYSLYMHLLPFDRYSNDDPAYDKRVMAAFGGRNARDLPKSDPRSKNVGEIQGFTQFDILEELPDDAEGYRFVKGRVVYTNPGQLKKNQIVWFATHQKGVPIKSKWETELLEPVHPPKRVKPTYWRGKVKARVREGNGLNMFRLVEAQGSVNRSYINEDLPQGYWLSFDNEHTRPATTDEGLRPMARCKSDRTESRGTPITEFFWAFVDDQALMDATIEPARLDTVIVPSTPVPIKAGDPVGYLGLHELPQGTGKKSKHQVHLEVFTCDPRLDAFLNNEAGLKLGKQYLHVPSLEGTVLGQHTESEFRSYLFQEHVFDLKKLPIVRKDDGKEYYKTLVKEKGPGQGDPVRDLEVFISTQSPSDPSTRVQIVSQHNLKALGFKVVQQHLRDSCSPLNDEQVCGFYAQLNALADANHDGKLSANELRETLRNPEFRDRWSKLVVLHHTEWQSKADSAKWQPMRDRLSNNPERWRHASERIDNSVFWDEVAQEVGLPADGRVSYFHPVEFIRALNDDFIDEDSLDWLIVPNGQLTFDVEGKDIDDPGSRLYVYFSRKVHWPGGASGITIGRGYDLGQRPNPEADFATANIDEPLLSWLLGAKGLQGQAAKNYLNTASEEIRTATISRKQQYDLFAPVYDSMKAEVLRVSRKPEVIRRYGALDWSSTHKKIQEVTIDLMYRGDYGPNTRAFLHRHITNNDLTRFAETISDRGQWETVPEDRFNHRIQCLR